MREFLAKKYQIHIVLNTYDLYEHDEKLRELLADNWGMKLRGYKKYFPYGVLPIDAYDFLAHHIIVSNRHSKKVVMGIKSLTLSSCLECKADFPAAKHLLGGKEKDYQDHDLAIKDWISQKQKANSDVAYSSSFTVEPALEKSEKRLLTDIVFYLFPYFYREYNIPNIIHGINKRNKLDLRQEDIGFEKLEFKNKPLAPIEIRNYDNVQCDVMVVNDLGFKEMHLKKAQVCEGLWAQREEYIGIREGAQKKKAA